MKKIIDFLTGRSLGFRASDVKVIYESNSDTNAFTDPEKAKVAELIPTLAEMTAEAFSYPKSSITNPFTNAGNEPGALDVDNYGAEAVPLSSSTAEPLQFTAKPKVPASATGFKYTIVVAPQSGQAWDGSDIAFQGEAKHVTDENAWSSVTSFNIATRTVPGSGSDVLVITATIALATMGLTAGDKFMACIEVDTGNTTWGNDIAFFSCLMEADDS